MEIAFKKAPGGLIFSTLSQIFRLFHPWASGTNIKPAIDQIKAPICMYDTPPLRHHLVGCLCMYVRPSERPAIDTKTQQLNQPLRSPMNRDCDKSSQHWRGLCRFFFFCDKNKKVCHALIPLIPRLRECCVDCGEKTPLYCYICIFIFYFFFKFVIEGKNRHNLSRG
jgi:hypothetical protein